MSWLRLLRSRRVGVSTFWRLMEEYGSAETALEALPGIAKAAGVTRYEICPQGVAEAEWASARRLGARLLCRGDADYPALLSEIPDPPPLLWLSGRSDALHSPLVAVVGARNASSLGIRMARKLARELGEMGLVVVSGLARGIDTAAHEAALPTGTVAVMAGGVDILYPSENTRLAEAIAATGGALLSEQPMGLQPQARHFPARNRIVSGLAGAVVVVEAAVKSGSLITARCALDQGREVLAVPGHPFDARSGGCNLLLRDGARLVRDAEDVMEALGPLETTLRPPLPQTRPAIPPAPPERRSLRETAALHGQILARLGPAPVAEDQLVRDLRSSAGELAPALTDLELEGRIRRRPGGLLTLLP